jgi:hypothetical protein
VSTKLACDYHGSSYPALAAESWAAFAFPVAAVDDSARVAIIGRMRCYSFAVVGKVVKLTSRNASKSGRNWGRATQGRKLPAITTATPTFKMVNTTSEDIIADPRAAITKLFGMDANVYVVNHRCCLQGWDAGRVDRLCRSPEIRSSLFRPRANTKSIRPFEHSAHIRFPDLISYPRHL